VKTAIPMAALLIVAAVSRLWAIGFCLPAPYCRPDEEAVVGIVRGFFARDFNPHFFDWPTLFMYLVAAAMVPYFQLGRWLGWFRGEYHFLQTLAMDATPVFLAARLVSAAAGVLSVWVLFRVARRLFDDTTALVASLFLALAFLHVRDSHFGVTDVPATCLVLMSFLYTIRFAQARSSRDVLVAALLAGLATSMKYNAALIAVPPMWLLFVWPGGPTILRRVRLALACALIGAFAFAATSPYALLEYPQFFSSMRGISAHLNAGHGVELGRGWVVHFTSSLWYGLGGPLLIAGLIGVGWLFRKQPEVRTVVALFPLTYYLLIGSGRTVFARYILPVVPFLCLTASFAVVGLAQGFTRRIGRPEWRVTLAWVLAALIVGPTAWSVVRFDRLLARTDSRVLAADWIRANIPIGTRIVQSGRMSTWLFFGPTVPGRPAVFPTTKWTGTAAAGDLLVVSQSPPGVVSDDDARRSILMDPAFSDYVLVKRIDAFDPNARGNVYDRQDEFYLPLAGFHRIERPGPSLTIFARQAFRLPRSQ
jgi:4-amino-4-deoxy-L-arabinose transferase-like glycosyltransferase